MKPAPAAFTTNATTTAQETNLFNVAVGKKATQTNDNPFVRDPYYTTFPAAAIDGNTDGSYYSGSLTHTWGNNHDPLDWWQVDLGGSYPITRVDLWNRTDCCGERLHDVYVLVSDSPLTSNVLADNLAQPGVSAYFQAGVLGTTTPVAVGRSGRFVRVVLSQPGPLSLAEVQVWSAQESPTTPANDPINIAEGRTAVQSATSYGGTPERAVDGYVSGYYPSGSVTWAGGSATPDWWQVDLGGIYPIDTIDIWNRTDCCGDYLHDFHVFVSDTPFTNNDPVQLAAQPTIGNSFTAGVAGERTTLTVGRTGRYVRVALSQPGVLMLAEVQVWSQQRTPLGVQAAEPTVVAWPRNGEMYLNWPKVAGATSYTVQRSDSPEGPFMLIATGIAQPIAGMGWYQYTDTPRTNDVFTYYVVTALDAAGRVVNRSDLLKAKPTTTATTSFDAYTAIPATAYTAAYAMREQDDTVLNRSVMNSQAGTHYLAFHNVSFGAGRANGVSLRYRASAPGAVTLVAQPANLVIGTATLTGTNGIWQNENLMIAPTSGVQTIYVFFASQGADKVQLDTLQFSAPGPFDTDTVKWDPNIVLLHKSMGIALDSFLLDQADMTMLMRFSTTTAQGRAQFALLKAGSIIASDTNLDLGGPYARVEQVVSLSDSQVAVKAAALAFNDLIYSGSFDASTAIRQAITDAMDASVGTTAKGSAFSAAGYDTNFPSDITYYNSADLTKGQGSGGGSQGSGSSESHRQNRTAGLGALVAQSSTPGIPTALPPEAKNSPKGTFHVTMDNAQFVKDENGWGIELVNLKMNALGIQPLPSGPPGSNPSAAQFGFGVLGGVGADKLMIQAKVEVDKGVISRNEMFSVKTQVTGTAHFQARGLAVALWFWEVPLKWLKPIRFVVPTAVGPIPCSIGFGVQGFIMAVGAGSMDAEKGYQLKLTQGGPPGKEVQFSDYGDTKLEFGQKTDSLSLFGVFFEPYVKLRVGTFGLEEADPAVVQQLLGWLSHWIKLTPEQLEKMEGFFVFTFTPRLYYMLLLQNWKDKDRPIHEQKVCVGPIVKAEALPGFPLPITFELRLEGPPYCVSHETWLQYDMKVPEGVLIDPNTGKGKARWGVPVLSEHARIPYQIRFESGFPYSEPGEPVVLSTNIADGWFNAAQRRRCLIFRKPTKQEDPVPLAYSGPCKADMTTDVQLLGDETEATFMLRVLTEYRHPFIPGDDQMIKNEYVGGGGLPWGVWSDKPFQVARGNDTTTFQVNATEVFSNSAETMDPIEGVKCDPDAQRALDMTLQASIQVISPTLTKLEDVRLEVDGVDIGVSYAESSDTRWQLKTQPMNLFSGAHSMTIVAKERSRKSDATYTIRYTATFLAQAKSCGPAKPDKFTALIFEGSRCAKQQTDEQDLPVLDNDKQLQGEQWKITGVSSPKLGTLRIKPDGSSLLYKPTSKGVDSFVYEVTITKPDGSVETAKANVLVTNRAPQTDAECTGGGNGGNSDKSGAIKNWGDPHVTTADGVSFDSHALGEFIYLQPRTGRTGITIHGRQQLYESNRFPAITTALAIRVGSHTIEFRASKTPYLLVDGQAPTASTLDLGDGASLTVGTPTSRITTGRTTIEVTRFAIHLESLVTLPLDNNLEGMWGTPNGSKTDDMALPNGMTTNDPLALADGWRISDRTKSLFTYANGEGPETYNQANVFLGQIPTAEALAPYVQQARDLLSNTCSTTAAPDEDTVKALALEFYIGINPNNVAAQLCSYELSGTITSANPAGAAVVGASVTLTSPQTQTCTTSTDLQGRYRCKLAPLSGAAAPAVTITVAGTPAQTYTFPARAPIGSTLTRTLDLVVTRPSIRLTVRTLDAAGASMPNSTVEVKSGSVIQRVTTGLTGTATLVLTYEPGTASAPLQLLPVFPTRGNGIYQTITLNPGAPVDVALDLRVVRLGTPRWRVLADTTYTKEDQPILTGTTAALGADGTIYTIGFKREASATGQLMAFTPDGRRKWVSSAQSVSSVSSAASPAVGPDGTIYVVGQQYPNVYLHAFNPDGTLKWSYTAPAGFTSISGRVAIGADGTPYVTIGNTTSSNTQLLALNPATGAVSWSGTYTDGNPPRPPVIAPNGTIYVFGSYARSFSPAGTLLATSTESTYRGMPTIGADGTIFLVWAARADDGGPGTLAFNPDLTKRWRVSVGGGYGAGLGPDGFLYIPASDALRKLDPATGATIWTLTAEPQRGLVIGADGLVYVQVLVRGANIVPDTSELLGVRPEGTIATRFKLNGALSSGPIMGPNGVIYTGVQSLNGNGSAVYDLYAIPTGSNSGPATGWPGMYGNSQNTGRRAP